MRRVYFDASALIKRYSQEVGTPLLNEVFERVLPTHMTCSVLGILEVVSILARKRNDGRLSQSLFEQAMAEFRSEVVDSEEFLPTSIDDALLLSATGLITKHNLNATDAAILRSALNLHQALRAQGDDLILWVSDKRLARAAQGEGLVVFDPEIETMSRVLEET